MLRQSWWMILMCIPLLMPAQHPSGRVTTLGGEVYSGKFKVVRQGKHYFLSTYTIDQPEGKGLLEVDIDRIELGDEAFQYIYTGDPTRAFLDPMFKEKRVLARQLVDGNLSLFEVFLAGKRMWFLQQGDETAIPLLDREYDSRPWSQRLRVRDPEDLLTAERYHDVAHYQEELNERLADCGEISIGADFLLTQSNLIDLLKTYNNCFGYHRTYRRVNHALFVVTGLIVGSSITFLILRASEED